MNPTDKKECLECKEPFKGRSDKKFCGDYCRNIYNNRKNSDSNKTVRNINNTLRKNRRILEKLNPEGKAKVHRMKLLDEGFNFNFYTNIYTTQNKKQYTFCYDQGYLEIDGDYYILVHKEEYI